jgi:hypothetical protein
MGPRGHEQNEEFGESKGVQPGSLVSGHPCNSLACDVWSSEIPDHDFVSVCGSGFVSSALFIHDLLPLAYLP